MTVSFRPAKREQIPLLLGVAGGTGSGKTMSALLMARGIAQGAPFAFVDTENGRGLHYADEFPEMQHGDLRAPFRPDAYIAAIKDGLAHLKDVPKEKRVVVVDSFSHEWTGDGGCLDWVDEITAGDEKKKARAWAKVKPAHRRMMTQLIGLPSHVIVCLRAEYGKVDIVRKDGKTEFVPKRTLPGGSLNDWYPESEKAFPYELTASFLVVADAPGVPIPLKLQEQHKPFVPLDQPLSEQTGRQLAAWAAGSAPEVPATPTLRGAFGVGNEPGSGAETSSGEPNVQASGHEQPAQATGALRRAPSPDVSLATSGGEPASPDDISQLTARLVAASSKGQEAAYMIEMHAQAHTPQEHYEWLLVQERKHFAGARGGDAA
jgi:hypothetical protein